MTMLLYVLGVNTTLGSLLSRGCPAAHQLPKVQPIHLPSVAAARVKM